MRTLTTGEAAAMLHVSPNTLRSWERRYDFPHAQRSPGQHRRYMHAEIEVLALALRDGLTVSSAISSATETCRADVQGLTSALRALRSDRAERSLEASLALRSLERTVEDVLLAGLAELRAQHGDGSAALGFAYAWATDWMRRMQRVVARGGERGRVLVCDATRAEGDPARPALRALELMCARAGVETVTLPAAANQGIAEAVDALAPCAIVVSGTADNGAVDVWMRSARHAARRAQIAYFMRDPDPSAGRVGAPKLPGSPSSAQAALLKLLSRAHRSAHVDH